MAIMDEIKIRNFTPSITDMSEDVLAIAARQPHYFRTNKFSQMLQQAEQNLLALIGCKKGRVAFIASSGSGAMDAAVSNLIEDNERVLVINGGTFGNRWAEICEFYKLNYLEFKPDFACDIDLKLLSTVFKQYQPTSVLMQATETSSMQSFAVKEVGLLCAKNNAKLIVDAITAFAIDEYHMDDYKVNATILSSQKGLNLTTGLAMIVLGKHQNLLKKSRNYYLDLGKYFKAQDEVSIPFTPNLIALEQLSFKLQKLLSKSLSACISEIQAKASTFRQLLIDNDLPLSLVPQTPSNCGSLLETQRTDVKDFCIRMQQKNLYFTPYGKYIGESNIPSNQFLVSHMGELSLEDQLFFIKELKEWLTS